MGVVGLGEPEPGAVGWLDGWLDGVSDGDGDGDGDRDCDGDGDGAWDADRLATVVFDPG